MNILFDIDENGLVRVHALDKKNKMERKLEMKMDRSTLSKDEVQGMIKDRQSAIA